jgi:hypothetical protein
VRKLLSELMKYKERFNILQNRLKPSEQYYLRSDIMTDLYRFENLLK